MRVKVCGVTTVADAAIAASAGAWAIGLVFDPQSPRYVGVEPAAEIVAAIPASVLTVGVFRAAPARYVEQVVDRTRVGAIQLHGAGAGAAVSLPCIEAVHLQGADDVKNASAIDADRLLIVDGNNPGSGVLADWALAERLARQRDVIIAGGLTPANVASAIAHVRPYAVDVSSGVESAPGVKDHGLIREFISCAQAEVAA